MEKISIILPTLNRPKDLTEMLKSLLLQSQIPDEVIIVDQSRNDESKLIAENLISNYNNNAENKISLKYILDTKITGAAQARNRAIELATGDIIFFFDDDVVLDKDFIKESLNTYKEYPDLAGVGGVITNKKSLNNFNIKIFNEIFCLGIFRDNRKKIFADFNKYHNPIYTNKLSGGCSSYKREVITLEKFDDTFDKIMDGYSFGEDIDLSLRIAKKHPLAITTRARLIHNPEGNERNPHTRQRCIFLEASSWTYIFLKNFSHSITAWLSFIWLSCGWLMRCISALLKGDTQTFIYFIKGVKYGVNLHKQFRESPDQQNRHIDMPNVLGIGLDYLMLRDDNVRGDVRARQLDYAKRLGSFHQVVYSPKELALKKEQWADNLYIYPTNSKNKCLFILDAFKIASRICKSNEINAITAEDPFTTGIIGYLLKKCFKIPLNVQTHIDFCDNQYWINLRKINKFFNILGKFILKRADTIRVGTKYEKEKLADKLRIKQDKISVIPVNADLSKFKGVDGQNIRAQYLNGKYDKLILFAGRLVQQKDIPTLFKAFKLVLNSRPSTLLLIGGSGSQGDFLKRSALELEISNNVVFTGNIPHMKIPQYLSACDVYVVPSIFEGTCIAMAEAMAAGRAVVVTKFAGARDLIADGENGFIVEQKDYRTMADRISDLIDNPERAKEMGITASKKIEEYFANNKNIDKVIELWQKTAGLKQEI
ncbi:MAG: glycosyltransferase [Candidatus Omnitrophota bacterium]